MPAIHGAAVFAAVLSSAAQDIPRRALDEILAAQHDLLGDRSLAEPDGPSYAFFAQQLPPLRYVNTAFRHYPIVLSLPNARTKARYVSNGSGINLPAGASMWHDEGLAPVRFLVDGEPFGGDLARLEGPVYAEGWLPIVRMTCAAPRFRCTQEVFVGGAAPWGVVGSDEALVFVRFVAEAGASGELAAQLDGVGDLVTEGALVRDGNGRARAWCGAGFEVDRAGRRLVARLDPGNAAYAAFFTHGIVPDAGSGSAQRADEVAPLDRGAWEQARADCAQSWRAVVNTGTRLVTGEAQVDAAWRSLVVGTLMLTRDDLMLYSHGNGYATTFAAECGDAVRALLLLGVPGAERLVAPLLARPLQGGIERSDVAFKLQLLAHDWQLARDPARTRRHLELVRAEVDGAIGQIDAATGLLPKENYCGDQFRQVHSLNVNANFWRGLRDLAMVLEDLGETEPAARFAAIAATLRTSVLAAVTASVRSDVTPPFVPVALFGAEEPHATLTATRDAAYWNLLAPFLVGAGLFGPRGPENGWILDTQRERGGLCMGMVRFHQHSGLFANENGVDDLYTLRHAEALLHRDEVDRALVAFYGKLAQGMTRDTFIGGEGSGLEPLETGAAAGRPMYLPPNCSANAFFLQLLRGLLVQEWDEDDDGRPETLHLLRATPRRWLADGQELVVERAVTTFGRVSIAARSRLGEGRVEVDVELPERSPRVTRLRLRLPDGWSARSARIGKEVLHIAEDGSVDLSGRRGRATVITEVARGARPGR